MVLKCETNIHQDLVEFNKFLELIKSNGVGSYLEIGSKFGGSFWRISTSLPKGSRVVAVDWPGADGSFKGVTGPEHLNACVDELKRRGYDAHLFLADSAAPETVASVQALAPFDLCFIDGCHVLEHVWKDWNNYGSLAKIVAFHDISWVFQPHKNSKKQRIEAPEVWNEVKQKHRHVEIRNDKFYNGIGVLWRDDRVSV